MIIPNEYAGTKTVLIYVQGSKLSVDVYENNTDTLDFVPFLEKHGGKKLGKFRRVNDIFIERAQRFATTIDQYHPPARIDISDILRSP